MENSLLDLKSKLCKAYFSIINSSLKTEIFIEELCVKSKVSIEDAQTVLPKMQKDYKIFFLTIVFHAKFLISKLSIIQFMAVSVFTSSP